MHLLYYLKRDLYDAEQHTDDFEDFTLNQNAPAMLRVKEGESIWAFTLLDDGVYALVTEFVVAAKGENAPGRPFGQHRVEANLERSKLFALEDPAQKDFEALVRRQLSITANAAALGQSFQGHAAVREITEEDHQHLKAFAQNLTALELPHPEDVPRRPSSITSPPAILAAMEEYDALGREAFLTKYGYGETRAFWALQRGVATTQRPS